MAEREASILYLSTLLCSGLVIHWAEIKRFFLEEAVSG